MVFTQEVEDIAFKWQDITLLPQVWTGLLLNSVIGASTKVIKGSQNRLSPHGHDP